MQNVHISQKMCGGGVLVVVYTYKIYNYAPISVDFFLQN